jgi:hypothetical protein
MLALAILAAAAAASRPATPDQPDCNAEIALTVPEVRRLINATLTAPAAGVAHLLRWSMWRRKVQARARRSHYLRRSDSLNDHEVPLEY